MYVCMLVTHTTVANTAKSNIIKHRKVLFDANTNTLLPILDGEKENNLGFQFLCDFLPFRASE